MGGLTRGNTMKAMLLNMPKEESLMLEFRLVTAALGCAGVAKEAIENGTGAVNVDGKDVDLFGMFLQWKERTGGLTK